MLGSPSLARAIVLLVLLLLGQGWSSSAHADLSRCKGYSVTGDLECTTYPQRLTEWAYIIPGPIQSTGMLGSADAAIEAYKPILTSGATLCGGISASVGSVDTTWYLHGPSGWNFHSGLNLNERYPVTFRYEVQFYGGTPYSYCSPREVGVLLYRQRQAECDYAAGWSFPNDDSRTHYCARAGAYEDRTCPTANPVLPGSGIKLLNSTDYAGAGAHALQFSRSYRSRWARADIAASMGGIANSAGRTGWLHNYERQIADVPFAPTALRRAIRHDGSVNTFTATPDAQGVVQWKAEPGVRDSLLRTAAGWDYKVFADDVIERYDTAGRLLSITERNGWVTTLSYSDATTPVDVAPKPGLLIRVANHFGRALTFGYEQSGRLAALVDPAGSAVRYGYDGFGNLASVTWQDDTTRSYRHEDSRFPGHVTGITDEAGVSYSTYAYDAQGRVASSELAGGAERLTFSYSSPGSFGYVYDATGTGRSYSFVNSAGVLRPSAVSAPCPSCGNTQKSTVYDTQGNPTKEIAHDGSVTFLAYDARGRETERAVFPVSYNTATTRPALANATRVVSTKWHATWNLPTQVAEPNKTTANTYNSKGLLTGTSWTATTDATGAAKFTALKTGSTYATGWSYSASNLITTAISKVDAVETQRYTMAYATNGDLTRITDVTAGNRIGRATSYDAQGRLLQATTIYGDNMSFVYSPRGFVISRTEAGKTTTYVQNAIGFTTNVAMPGASVATFEYDSTHRLAGVRLNGVLLAQGAARDGVPRNLALARASQLLERMMMQSLPSAHAQAGVAPRLMAPGSATAGSPLPGQPSTQPGSVLTASDNPGDGLEPDRRPGPLPLFDPSLIRPLAERITKFCSCDPDGGFSKPKLTATSMIHIVMGGHVSQVYRNQSYFTEPVNQTLVDEVVSRDNTPDAPGATRRVYYVADMGRVVGMSPKGDGTFEPTRAVKLVVHKDNCSNLWRVYNEVITMYPAR